MDRGGCGLPETKGTNMPIIDVHAHINPRPFLEQALEGGTWHSMGPEQGELENPRNCWSVEERIADMDRLGMDMQLLTPFAGYFKYRWDPEKTLALARDVNDDLSGIIAEFPDRFCALGTVPMQDPAAAVTELRRAVTDLGLKGVTVCDHVDNKSYDLSEFLPFWEAAEELGAVVEFHQSSPTVVDHRIDRYFLANTVGNLVDRALLYGTLVQGGIIDRFPGLKLILCHGGGYTAFATARMDLGWYSQELDYMEDYSAGEDATQYIERPPSEYMDRFYYDCLTGDEPSLRFLIDRVGIDQVVFGTDYPCPMEIRDAVNWINGLESLTADEKDAILRRNPSRLLGYDA
jgi:aminocarboxymuconate-semialdehyde decarboxylase